jgi:hypothetical protein
MRWFTPVVAACLLLAVSSTGWSAIIFTQPYNGPVTLKFTGWDMGVVYAAPAGLVNGIGAVNTYEAASGVVYPAASGGLYYSTNGSVVPVNDPNREDAWGILTVTEIYKSGTSSTDPANILWLSGNGGKELTAILYGMVDNAVTQGAIMGQEVIQSQNFRYDLYENPAGSFAAVGGQNQGSAGRTGFNQYNGITNVAGGVLSIQGLSIPGIGQITGSAGPDELTASFTPNVVGGVVQPTGSGTFGALLALNAATALLQRDYAQFNTDGMPLGADLTANGTTYPNDGTATQNGLPIANWTVLIEDPLRGNVIPEPATLCLLAVGGLVALRRRR